jgi:hypothetical protein
MPNAPKSVECARLLSREVRSRFQDLFGCRMTLEPSASLAQVRDASAAYNVTEGPVVDLCKGVSLKELSSRYVEQPWRSYEHVLKDDGHFLLSNYSACGTFLAGPFMEQRDLIRLVQFDGDTVYFFDRAFRRAFVLDFENSSMTLSMNNFIPT